MEAMRLSRMKSRRVRLTEALFGSILGFVLTLIAVGVWETPLTLPSGLVGAASGIGIGVLVTRAWRK